MDESNKTDESFNTSDINISDITENGQELNISSQTESDDPEMEIIKARVKEMEEEAKRIHQLQSEVDEMTNTMPAPRSLSPEDKMEIDTRSIYVGNVDYEATSDELQSHFNGCGAINRVTIHCDRYSGHPKGFAYIEFADRDSVLTALALDDSIFRGRQIKVLPKRTNVPGISSTNRPPRGRFRRVARGGYYRGYRPMRRPMRRRVSFYPY